MSGSPTPNTFVDVTDKFERKLAALRAHVSQTEHMEDLEGMIRGWMTETARRGGLPEGRLAEMFHAVTLG
jgi:LmbE family N-acetylglucosaminyl deacetylase